jgi:hypothetical protein
MRLSVVIPFRPRDPIRDRNRVYVEDWLDRALGEPDTVLADDPGRDFNRGRALDAGVPAATGDLLVLADADLIVPAHNLWAGVEAVENGAAMVVPFTRREELTAEATAKVLAGAAPEGLWGPEHLEYVMENRGTGGINILTRATFEAVGGFDPRFAGWGYEDSAFADAVETLVGRVEWLTGTAVHLWHPQDPTRSHPDPAVASASVELCKRYTAAWGDREAMRALIAER